MFEFEYATRTALEDPPVWHRFLEPIEELRRRIDQVFRNQFSSPADQQREKIKRSRAERDLRSNPGLIQPAQTTCAPVEPKTLKLENVCRTEPVHPIVPLPISAVPEDTTLGPISM
jgi:hypothetical protein